MKLGLIGSAFRRDDPTGIPTHLQVVLDPSTRAVVYLPRVSRFPHNPFDLKIQELGYLEAGLDAIEDGCDAVMINSVGDYGLAALKAAATVPVVGAGQAGMTLASTLGGPFAIVTVWPNSTAFLYASVLRDAGLQATCSQTVHVGSEDELSSLGTGDDYIARMQRGEASMIDRIVGAAQRCADAGARSILLGCTCMSGVAAEIARRVSVPVVDPMTAAALQAQNLVRLGLSEWPGSTRRPDAVSLAMLRTMVAAASGAGVDDVCEVCALVPGGPDDAACRVRPGAAAPSATRPLPSAL